MKRLPVLLLVLLSACTVPDVVQERMVISPSAIVFPSSRSDTTVSITHTCSCPFSWTATLDTVGHHSSAGWLTLGPNFPASMTGDHASIPLSIDRSKLLASRDTTTIVIASNSYGVDSIVVIAVK